MANWKDIAIQLGSSPFSATNPTPSPKGRAVRGQYDLSHKPTLATRARLNKRYILKTDVSQFYASIYTHAIPWAIMGKTRAKTNRKMSHFANRLDYWVRMGQDGETVGIPIGPDTSLILAELILQRCDDVLLTRLPRVKGYRYIDDYELGFRERSEAEAAYHILESVLGTLQLALNVRKTDVLPLPLQIEPNWVRGLRTFAIRESTAGAQRRDLVDYFDEAFALQQAFPEDDVLQYAVGRLRSVEVSSANWLGFQRRLLLCAAPEPACLLHVLSQVIERVNGGFTADTNALAELVNLIVLEHASLRHSSEVAWALWAAIALHLPLDSDSVDALAHCDDPVVALLALHADSLGLAAKRLDTNPLLAHMTAEGLYDDHWLLVYEASVKGWLGSADGSDIIAKDPAFDYLRRAGVSFYEPGLVVPTSPTGPIPVPASPSVALVGDAMVY